MENREIGSLGEEAIERIRFPLSDVILVAVAVENDGVGCFEEGGVFGPSKADLRFDSEAAFVEALGEQLAAGGKFVLIPSMAGRAGDEEDAFRLAER